MTLYGKGYYLWQIPKVLGGDPQAITARAVEAGLSHVLIKIADGATWAYNYDYDRRVDLIPPVRDALRSAGISVLGWHYVRGDDPIGEARIAVDRMKALGLDGYVIDAEIEYRNPAKKVAASRYMQDLRKGLKKTPISLSSYRYPQIHRGFPFETFLERCEYAMPQVYFEQAHNPEEQLDRTLAQYMAFKNARPVIPTGPTYSHAGWRASGDEIRRFMVHAKSLGLSAVNFWAYDFAIKPSFDELWDVVRDFKWKHSPPIADMPERLIGRLNQHDTDLIAGLYLENAAHVTGARTVVGRGPVKQWYQVLLKQLLPKAKFTMTGKSGTGSSRHFTWTAESDTGKVFDGNDTLGLRNGRIQYHYTYFTITT
jgi:hypothetical protein